MNHLKLALFIFVNSLFFESYAVSNWIFRYPVAILLFSINALWLPLNNIDKVDSYAARFYSGFFFGAIISAYAALPAIVFNCGYANRSIWLRNNAFLLICVMTVGGLLNAVIRAVVHHNYPNLSLSFDNMEILCPVILVSGLAATILWYLGQRLLRDYPASPLHDTATHDPLFSKSETPPNSLLVASLLFVFSLVAGLASAGNPGPYLYLISFLYVPFQLLNFPDNQFFSNFRIGFLFGSLIAIPAALPVILYNWGYASWWSWLKSNVFLLICSIPIGSLPLVVVFYNVNLSMGLQGWPHFSDPYSIASFILSALIPSVLWYLMQSRKLRSTKAGN